MRRLCAWLCCGVPAIMVRWLLQFCCPRLLRGGWGPGLHFDYYWLLPVYCPVVARRLCAEAVCRALSCGLMGALTLAPCRYAALDLRAVVGCLAPLQHDVCLRLLTLAPLLPRGCWVEVSSPGLLCSP